LFDINDSIKAQCVGYILGGASYALAGIVTHTEMDVFVPENTWLLRMPLVATFAAQLAKLRSVVFILGTNEKTYFFWLFVVLIGLQGVLALWAIALGCPSRKALQVPQGLVATGYEVRIAAGELVLFLSCMAFLAYELVSPASRSDKSTIQTYLRERYIRMTQTQQILTK
jgi:hypothetical protein